jgi:hypothetical protein
MYSSETQPCDIILTSSDRVFTQSRHDTMNIHHTQPAVKLGSTGCGCGFPAFTPPGRALPCCDRDGCCTCADLRYRLAAEGRCCCCSCTPCPSHCCRAFAAAGTHRPQPPSQLLHPLLAVAARLTWPTGHDVVCQPGQAACHDGRAHLKEPNATKHQRWAEQGSMTAETASVGCVSHRPPQP